MGKKNSEEKKLQRLTHQTANRQYAVMWKQKAQEV